MSSLVIAVDSSDNKKIGRAAATYAPIRQTCPSSCAFLDNGCYAQVGRTAPHNRRLEVAARKAKAGAVRIAKAEAAAIRQLSGDKPLRLHVTGDARTHESAAILAKAAADYSSRHGQPVWCYSHAWRKVPREAWGAVSVLASTESIEGVKKAMSRGYAAAIVVAELPGDGKAWKQDGIRFTPCPEMTRGIQCTDCLLCLNDFKLKERKAVIAFGAHGSGAKRVREVIGEIPGCP